MIYSYYDGPHGRTTFYNDTKSLVRMIPDGEDYGNHRLLLSLHKVEVPGVWKNEFTHYDENPDTLEILQSLPRIPKDPMRDGL